LIFAAGTIEVRRKGRRKEKEKEKKNNPKTAQTFVIEQESHNPLMTMVGGQQQGRLPLGVGEVNNGAIIKEELGHIPVSLGSRDVQGDLATPVVPVDVNPVRITRELLSLS